MQVETGGSSQRWKDEGGSTFMKCVSLSRNVMLGSDWNFEEVLHKPAYIILIKCSSYVGGYKIIIKQCIGYALEIFLKIVTFSAKDNY